MPYVKVQSVKGRSDEQKLRAGKAITEAIVEHLGAHADHVYVVFEDVEDTDWMVGGETVAERKIKRGES
ncbi:MAG: 4-oxalocrotonate tautomerase family protein [Rhodospirillales bacterium]|nr:4-oxalocrotonate tautomerase family protein [Rhodospirillales bacterium]